MCCFNILTLMLLFGQRVCKIPTLAAPLAVVNGRVAR